LWTEKGHIKRLKGCFGGDPAWNRAVKSMTIRPEAPKVLIAFGDLKNSGFQKVYNQSNIYTFQKGMISKGYQNPTSPYEKWGLGFSSWYPLVRVSEWVTA
jgi:hypothetical protein